MSKIVSRSALLLLVPAIVACGAIGPPDLPFAHLLPVARSNLVTNMVWRHDPATLRALGRGWDVDVDSELVEGIWALGKEAEVHLFVVQEGAHTLAFEAVPPEGAAAQGITFRLNGERLGRALSIQPGWHTYQVELPAERLRLGSNRIDLSFSSPIRPAEIGAGDDDRLLSARFRYLRLIPPVERPAPAGVGEAEDFEDAEPAATLPAVPTLLGQVDWRPRRLERPDLPEAIELLAGSTLQIAMALPERATLVGEPEVVMPEGGSGHMAWAVELLEDDGSVHTLATGSRGAWFGNTLAADLTRWSGQTVSLRFRTWGSADGSVLWSDLGIVGNVNTRQFEPPPRPIVETSGRLGKPDIVVILLDAARVDAFSTFRGATSTPNVDALAADGTRFEGAYAPAPWTGQSVYSLFTGRYPDAHGVIAWKDQLPAEIRTLFQIMYAEGYHTYLWTEHPVYRGTRSLRFDVDTFVDIRPSMRDHRREILPSASGPEAMFQSDKPSFAFVHLVPPHADQGVGYRAPAPYFGTLSNQFAADLSPVPEDLQRWSHSLGMGAPTAEQIRYVWSRYLENVQYADELVGRIVEEIKSAGRYDDALVILLADHGEAFFEHGHFLHTWPLYQEVLRIPLVIKWPRNLSGFDRAIDLPVSLIDVAPTLLDGLGVDAEELGYQGQSLLPIVYDDYVPARDIYASTAGVSLTDRDDEPLKPMATILHRGLKLIWNQISGQVELYDVRVDPGEEDDLSTTRPATTQALFQRLRLQQQANALLFGGLEIKEVPGELDPEVIERLQALGYMRS